MSGGKIHATITTPDGTRIEVAGIDDVAMLRALTDTTRIEHTSRSFKASGDEVIVLWRKGAAADRVAAALERFEREVTSSDLDPAWMNEWPS